MQLIFLKILAICFACCSVSYAQTGYEFVKPHKKKETIHFKLVNNLIIISADLNGTILDFLVDTGANNNLLFNDVDINTLNLDGLETISLKGLGLLEPIQVVTSVNNTLKIKNLINTNTTFKIFQNADINFSERLGVTVHGIIGSSIIADFVTEINYEQKKIVFHNTPLKKKKTKKHDVFSVETYNNRYFITPTLELKKEHPFAAKLLLDTGATDSVWLFNTTNEKIEVPTHYIEDFLGSAIGGDIHGKIARLPKFYMGSYAIKDDLVAFPDSTAVKLIKGYNGRNGSLGAGMLKRFNHIFNVKEHKMFFRKNHYFDKTDEYNMSGIEIAHDGTKIVSAIDPHLEFELEAGKEKATLSKLEELHFYQFKLTPIFKIIKLLENSPAAIAGLRVGDQLISVNGKKTKNHSLQEIVDWFSEEDQKEIRVLIKRGNLFLRYSFKLKRFI